MTLSSGVPSTRAVDLFRLPLTAALLAERWHIDTYTVREWAKVGLIVGANRATGRWRFPAAPLLWVATTSPTTPSSRRARRLRVASPSPDTHVSIDLALYPLTASALAFRWGLTTATIRRWAGGREITPAIAVHGDWRFAEDCVVETAGAARPTARTTGRATVRDGSAARADALSTFAAMDFGARRAPANGAA